MNKRTFKWRKGQDAKATQPILIWLALDGRPGSQDNNTTSCTFKPSNRNQRCFSQFDRKTDCYRNGAVVHLINESGHSGVVTRPCKAGDSVITGQTQVQILLPAPFTVAVCGTQTRQDCSLNMNSQWINRIQALSTPDNLVGGASNREPYLHAGWST